MQERPAIFLAQVLTRALKAQRTQRPLCGRCGPRMQAEGREARHEMEASAVMGIVEVLGRLRRLLHIRADSTPPFLPNSPDVFVGD